MLPKCSQLLQQSPLCFSQMPVRAHKENSPPSCTPIKIWNLPACDSGTWNERNQRSRKKKKMLLLWGSFNEQSENKFRLIRQRKESLCMVTPVKIISIFTESISYIVIINIHCTNMPLLFTKKVARCCEWVNGAKRSISLFHGGFVLLSSLLPFSPFAVCLHCTAWSLLPKIPISIL